MCLFHDVILFYKSAGIKTRWGDFMARCLLVSNRLPISFNQATQEFETSAGGLVSAIKGLDANKVGYTFEWMGILTDEIDNEIIKKIHSTPVGDLTSHPIVVSKEIYNQYYNGFCNNVLWPLFHYERAMIQQTDSGWKAYQEINEIVADSIIKTATEDDTIWIHDFHFLLVPGLIKMKRPELKVGFFLHIPFPSSEVFRELPQRKEILLSLAQCDLVGFHDLSYLTHFKSSLLRVLGESTFQFNERKWGVYPISIDTDHFIKLAKAAETQEYIERYKLDKKDKKWILGVDRLDYIKGLVLKLEAFSEFLRRYPEEREKVQLIQIVIPSRTEVPEYKSLKNKVEQLVSSINGQFGSPTHSPVHYLYHQVSPHELSALYQLSEVMHIGSRRDGMNLVSLEYVVSQRENSPGTLLLSEFTGAHSTLSYAISINPWNIEETAVKISEALAQPHEQRRRDIMAMQEFLIKYTSSDWAHFFLRDLHREVTHPEKRVNLSVNGKFPWLDELIGKRVLIFCDLDGTLAPISRIPSEVRIKPETEALLKEMSHISGFQLIVVSGRDKEFLEQQFIQHQLEFPLAACHGAYAYLPDNNEWTNLIPHDSTKWKESVVEILKLYTSRTPGSFIEDKGHAITWHYRNSPPEFADFLANKVFLELEESLSSQSAQVTRGKKVIEVKSLHASKGYFVQHWLEKMEYLPDAVIAIGDDTTDEDMFEFLQTRPEIQSYCIKVGEGKSAARYFIKDQRSVNYFLKNFLEVYQERVH
jgi:trehalose 6-phosphate synthase/phosphatase